MRVVLVFVAALVSLVTVGVLGALAFGLSGAREVTDTQKLPGSVRSLTLDTGDIPLSVRLTTEDDAEELRVSLRIAASTNDIHLAVANDGASGRVTLHTSGSGFPRYIRGGEIEVAFPPDVARELSMKVNHRTGSLSTNADLNQLVANVQDGAVVLGGSARQLGINVRHGDISTSTPIAVAETFTADTQSGAISVEFREAPRTTEAVATGDVTVRLPAPGPYRVRAQSGGRLDEATVTVPETISQSAPEVMARSTGAGVTVAELR